MEEFEAFIMARAAKIVQFVRRISTPYMLVFLMIGALLLSVPGRRAPMGVRVTGWSIVGTVLVAYGLIWWGPLLLGVMRGFASP